MYQCEKCGAQVEDGLLCSCRGAQEERAMVKEAMAACLNYLAMTDEDGSIDGIVEANEAFRVVMTELAEKYGQEPKAFMEKVIDAMEEFLEEG